MRNNQDRLGNFVPEQDQSIAQANQPVFSYVTPTDLVDLPSKGRYYHPAHPLHQQASVEIKEMTAKEEDILYNKSYLEKGVVLDKLLESIFINKAIDPKSLIVSDKNAILIKARIQGYGNLYPVGMECPECGSKTDTEVDLNELLKIIEPVYSETVKLLENGLVSIVLPSTKWIVEVRPLSGYDQEKLQKILEGRRKNKLEENALIETIKAFIFSINGLSDEASIQAALTNMPAKDSKYLRNIYGDVFPNISSVAKAKCGICDSETDLEVPFNLNFFWSDD
jgi:hypothetical protein